MSLLQPSDPKGVRAISYQPWFIYPTLVVGATSVDVELPVPLAYYHVKVTVGVTDSSGSWQTTWGIRNQTQAKFTVFFSSPIPSNGQIQVEISG